MDDETKLHAQPLRDGPQLVPAPVAPTGALPDVDGPPPKGRGRGARFETAPAYAFPRVPRLSEPRTIALPHREEAKRAAQLERFYRLPSRAANPLLPRAVLRAAQAAPGCPLRCCDKVLDLRINGGMHQGLIPPKLLADGRDATTVGKLPLVQAESCGPDSPALQLVRGVGGNYAAMVLTRGEGESDV